MPGSARLAFWGPNIADISRHVIAEPGRARSCVLGQRLEQVPFLFGSPLCVLSEGSPPSGQNTPTNLREHEHIIYICLQVCNHMIMILCFFLSEELPPDVREILGQNYNVNSWCLVWILNHNQCYSVGCNMFWFQPGHSVLSSQHVWKLMAMWWWTQTVAT